MPSVRLTSGKADFIKRVSGGRTIDVCLLEYNADLSRGCISQVLAQHMQEVMTNNGKYAPGNYSRYYKDGTSDMRCNYCYAWGKNSGSVAAYSVDEITRNDFVELKPKFLRIGKLTEPGHPVYMENLIKLLRLCKEFSTTPILTTKMLPFGFQGLAGTPLSEFKIPDGEELASILEEANTSLLFSLGYDQIERGAVSQGFTNNWRINQARDFYRCGVNTSLTVVCDVTDSIENNVLRGSFIGRALDEKADCGINVRVIPARLYTHKSTMVITGLRKKLLTDSGFHRTMQLPIIESSPTIDSSRYRRVGMLKSVPNYLHPDFAGLIEKGMGICGAVAGIEHCDKCNCFGETRIEFPETELTKIIFEKPTRRQENAKRKKIKALKNQEQFAFD